MSRAAPLLTTQPEALPAAVRELARVLGDADAMRLIGSMPGARVSVPKRTSRAYAEHPLRMALSPEGFDKLVDEWGGGLLDVPKGDAYLRKLRHDHVRQCREQGLTFDQTADATGYSRRQCMNIMGGHADDDEDTLTHDMFPEDTARARKALRMLPENAEVASQAGLASDPFGLARQPG